MNSEELASFQKKCEYEEAYTLDDVRTKLNSMQSGLVPAAGVQMYP